MTLAVPLLLALVMPLATSVLTDNVPCATESVRVCRSMGSASLRMMALAGVKSR